MMKKTFLLGLIFLAGIFQSFWGCNEQFYAFYKIHEITWKFGEDDSYASGNYIDSDTLWTKFEIWPEYFMASKRTGCEPSAYAWQYPNRNGELGFREKLVDLHLMSSIAIAGIPPGEYLEGLIYIEDGYSVADWINWLNEGELAAEQLNGMKAERRFRLVGEHTESQMQLSLQFVFYNAEVTFSSPIITWLP